MKTLLHELRRRPLFWLLVFVPLLFIVHAAKPQAHTLHFVMSVVAIVPLAALLSWATEAVASRTGDMIGGLLNATLGNLTELVIVLTALGAGQYMLVKASIAGAIITNVLFMLGTSMLLGGLKHRLQTFRKPVARLQTAMLLLATFALLVPSAIATTHERAFVEMGVTLSLALAFLLLLSYALATLFSLRTHREIFAAAAEGHAEAELPLPVALAILAGVTV